MKKITVNMKKALALFKKHKIIRTSEILNNGIYERTLYRLEDEGFIHKISRGLFELTDYTYSENHSMAQISIRQPKGIFCLISALQFYQLTTQIAHEHWLAVPVGIRKTQFCSINIRYFTFSEVSYNAGVDKQKIDGIDVKVYCPAKTVADCFKFRSVIGLDVAIEALRDTYHNKRTTIDDIWKYAKMCRVANIIRPYMESL